MKKLKIQVEGKVYEVTVEVLEDDETPNGVAAKPTLPPVRNESPGPRPPATTGGPPPANGHGHGAQDQHLVRAPIAGTVQKVFVQAGGHIEAKAPVVLLDAMKMDTYIYAPHAGTIAKVGVNPGDAVRVGQMLFEYEQEA